MPRKKWNLTAKVRHVMKDPAAAAFDDFQFALNLWVTFYTQQMDKNDVTEKIMTGAWWQIRIPLVNVGNMPSFDEIARCRARVLRKAREKADAAAEVKQPWYSNVNDTTS